MTNPTTNGVTPACTPLRVAYLDSLLALGSFIEFYDPTGARYGLPTYPYHYAPTELATRRQLRAAGLHPARQPVAAQILWWHTKRHKREKRVAYLYPIAGAKAKTPASPAQLAAVHRALQARRTCPTCGQVKAYYIPRRHGECLDCAGVI
jgi:hypothetical protein